MPTSGAIPLAVTTAESVDKDIEDRLIGSDDKSKPLSQVVNTKGTGNGAGMCSRGIK